MSDKTRFHFTGICGTAMGAVAAAMKQRGFTVTGSDANVYPPMSDFLRGQGITLSEGYAEENIPADTDVVIIGNAISRGNPEAEAALDRKLLYHSLPEVMKEFFLRGKRNFVVSGTHGKTTTSAMLAWIFKNAGRDPGYMIGGLPKNLGHGAHFTDSEFNVLEGDEYDTAFFDKRSKFIHYLPEVAIINNVEMDHADIFENLAAIQLSFRRFINVIPRNGLLLANGDDPAITPLLDVKHFPVKRFGLGAGNDFRADGIELRPEGSTFRIGPTEFTVPLVGEFNVRNALAVAACARHCGFGDAQIQSAFSTFMPVKRRLEVRGEARGVKVIDDFGHHPTAIRETLRALRVMFPGRKLWAVFEPRSNTTRRNIFQNELVDALERADAVVVAEVARLEQLPVDQRLNPYQLMEELRLRGRPASYLPTVDAIVEHVAEGAKETDVVCVFSNGGFGGIHDKLLKRLAS